MRQPDQRQFGRRRRLHETEPMDLPTYAIEASGLAPAGLPSDEIVYTAVDGPSPFAHPMCPNTFRDGKKVGDETPAQGY